MKISRAGKSRFSEWWFTADHALFAAVLALMGASLIVSLAASPAVAIKKGLPAYYFFERHLALSLAGAGLMGAISFVSAPAVRRVAAILFLASVAGLIAVLGAGEEINGARRWLDLGGLSLQPSEFVKPAFVVLSAWLLAEARLRPDMPAMAIGAALLVLVAALLGLEPDIGQTLLVCVVWLALFHFSGQPFQRTALLLGIGAAALAAAYAAFGHVRVRVDLFLNPAAGANAQVGRAMQSFRDGGFFGKGPGEGTIKSHLPDAHSDFVFAVIAEEYGAVACLALAGLFAFVVLRALSRARTEPGAANRLAIIGLALTFGLQALINMAVSTGLMPAKGLTLPFISAGGSSIIASSIGLGMILALARRRPGPGHAVIPRWTPVLDESQAMGRDRRAPGDCLA